MAWVFCEGKKRSPLRLSEHPSLSSRVGLQPLVPSPLFLLFLSLLLFQFPWLRGKKVNLLFYLMVFHFSFGKFFFIFFIFFFVLRYLGIFLINFRTFLFIKNASSLVFCIYCRYFSIVETNFLPVRHSRRDVGHESSFRDAR